MVFKSGCLGLVVLVGQFRQVIPHFKALGLLILIISVLDQFHDVAPWHGPVEIGAVALWYKFLLVKDFIARIFIAKAPFSIINVKNTNFLPLHNVIKIFRILMISESIISPVNRNFLFDWLNFIVKPLRVSVHVWVSLIWWMHAAATWRHDFA